MISRAKDGQSLLDLALMVTGATEGVWALALRNGMRVTDAPGNGAEVAWEAEDVEDTRTASRYEAEGIAPATAVSARTLGWLLNEEIAEERPAHEAIKADPVKKQSARAAIHGVEFTAAFA